MRWEVPQIWKGATVCLLGGGPSLTKVDIERLQPLRVIAINNAYQLAPWAEICFFMDCCWLEWHRERIFQEFMGLIVTVCDQCNEHPTVKYVQRGRRDAWEPRSDYITHCSNAGAHAVYLAMKLGAKRIILFGYDMKAEETTGKDGRVVRHNWHTDHKRNIATNIYEHQFLKSFEAIPQIAKKRNVEILNATPGSALSTFPIVSPEEVYP